MAGVFGDGVRWASGELMMRADGAVDGRSPAVAYS